MVKFDTSSLGAPASGEGEDRSAIITSQVGIVIMVADGAGGLGGGAEAAAMLIDLAADDCRLNGLPRDDLACCALLSKFDQLIEQDAAAGERTAVLAVITPSDLYGASVGDSQAWLVLPDEWYELTGGQSRKPFIGSGDAIPEPFNGELRDGTLVVATDGLWKYVDHNQILNAVRQKGSTSADLAATLISAVRLPNGSLCDDVTVAACRRSEPL